MEWPMASWRMKQGCILMKTFVVSTFNNDCSGFGYFRKVKNMKCHLVSVNLSIYFTTKKPMW